MTFPTTALRGIRVGELASARPGQLVSFAREHAIFTGLALGEPDAAATHLLIEHDGMPRLYAFGEMRDARGIHVDPTDRLVLDIGDDEVDAHRLPNYVGSIALTGEGLVACVSGGPDGFRGHALALVCLTTFRVLETRYDLFGDATWFTNWSLSCRGATDELTRLVGSPQWPDAARIQR